MRSRRVQVCLALLVVTAMLLAACGPKAPVAEPTAERAVPVALETTAAPTQAPTEPPTVAPTKPPTVAPTTAPTDAPTKEPTKAPTEEPAVSPTPGKGGKSTTDAEPTDEPDVEEALAAALSNMDEALAEAYSMFLMIDACAVSFEEMATSIEAGDADPEQTFGAIIILSAMLEMVDERLAEGPPDDALQEAWDEALDIMPQLRAVTEEWFGGEISAAEVSEEFEPVGEQINEMIALADEALVSELGVDADDLDGVRDLVREAVAEALRQPFGEGLSGMGDAEDGDTPVVANDAIEIVDATWFLDFSDDLVFIGELRNTGDVTVGSAEVMVTLVGEKGEVVATTSGMALVSSIPPGGVAPFSVDFLDDPGDFDDYEIVVEAYPLDDWMAESVYTEFSMTRELDRGVEGDYYALVCEAENVGDGTAGMIEAIVTAYDAQGHVVGVGSTMSEQNRVMPGELATFNVGLNVIDDVASHTVLFDAYADDVAELPDLVFTNITWLTDRFGDPYFVGEVRNNGSEPATGVLVSVTIDDADGELAGTDSGYALLDLIPAGGSAPFSVTFWNPVPDDGTFVATVEGEIAGDWTLDQAYDGLEIIAHSQRPSDEDEFVVAGRLENVGDETAEYIEVIVTGWDVEGDVVVAAYNYVDFDTLEPGDTAPFEITAYAPVEVEEYVLQVEGRIAD